MTHVAITGGARGIGAATARAPAPPGDQRDARRRRRRRRVATAQRLGAVGLPLDVTDRASFDGLPRPGRGPAGALTALVNNAGIMPIGPFVTEPDEVAGRQVDINRTA